MRVTQQQISKWERGIATPRDDKRTIVARIVGVPTDELFAYPEDGNGGEQAA